MKRFTLQLQPTNIVKTLLAVMLISCLGLSASAEDAVPVNTNVNLTTDTNQEAAVRRALREAMEKQGATNAVAPETQPRLYPRKGAEVQADTVKPEEVTPEAPAPTVPAPPPASPAAPTEPAAPAEAQQPPAVTPETPAVPAVPTAPTPTQPAPVRPIEVPTEQPSPTIPSVAAPAAEPAIDPGDEIIPHPVFSFPATDLSQVLEIYAQFVGRTVLRPSTLPNVQITLVTQTPLTRREAIQALDSVLALNGITMIPVGEKFVKALSEATAFQAAAAFTDLKPDQLPEAGQYVTHIAQLKYVRPSEIVPVLQPFAKIPQSILPIDATQILVLRDYAENVKRMLEIIEKVDITVPLEFEPVVIPIKYALAGDIATVLSSLTAGGGGTTVGTSTRRPSQTTTPAGGTAFPAAGPGGQAVTPQATFGGAPGARPGTPGSTGTFTDRLQQIVSRAAQAGDIQIIGPTKIIADERTNSLLIFATKQDMVTIRDIVEKLDVVLAQVLIEAIIMEVSLDDGKSMSVSAAQRPKQITDDFFGFGGFRNTGVTNLLSPVATNMLGSIPSGFSYAGLLGSNWEVALTAIATDSRINVLSRPRIQTSHAVPATLFIGNSVPFVTGTVTDIQGGFRSQFQNQRVGITLDVLPLINPDGLVVMDIRQDVQQLGVPTVIDGNPVPTTTERNALTKVAVKDRDTIILGGFISSTKTTSKSGVPYLKDIPLLGALFRSKSDSNQRVELIALIRPTVLPTPEAAALQTAIEKERLPGVMRAEREFQEEENKRLKKK